MKNCGTTLERRENLDLRSTKFLLTKIHRLAGADISEIFSRVNVNSKTNLIIESSGK